MSPQHVICLVCLVKLNAWKAEEEDSFRRHEKRKYFVFFVRCLYEDHAFRA